MSIANVLQNWPLQALAAIIAGVVILLAPRVLNYAIAAYLLVFGGLGFLHFYHGHALPPQAVVALVAGVLVLIKPAILSYVVGIYLLLTGLLDAGILRF
jgi:uncharacterized membrane protein HdeD (DUF308 family)